MAKIQAKENSMTFLEMVMLDPYEQNIFTSMRIEKRFCPGCSPTAGPAPGLDAIGSRLGRQILWTPILGKIAFFSTTIAYIIQYLMNLCQTKQLTSLLIRNLK